MTDHNGFSMASRTSSSSGSKAWLFRNVVFLIGAAVVGFFLLMLRFETRMHKNKKVAAQDLKLQHHTNTVHSTASNHAKRHVAQHKKTKIMNWKPITHPQCFDRGVSIDPFPDNFDAALYRETYGTGRDYHHYIEVGRKEGYECTRGQRMKEIFNGEIVPHFLAATAKRDQGMLLEIGPWFNPMMVHDTVKYFDLMDLQGLKERAEYVGYPEIHPVEIDYVSPSGDLSIIPDKGSYSLVASSNVLPNVVDLVLHLQQVGDLLKDGGYYALTLSDKRYTFDHYLAETSIAEVLDDYYEKRGPDGLHKMRSVLEHRALTVHNDIEKHWAGQSGSPYSEMTVPHLKNGIGEYEQSKAESKYADVHNYHFTPQGLAFLVDAIYNLDLSRLRVHRLYETMNGRFEFGIVLKKCPSSELLLASQKENKDRIVMEES